MTQNIHPHYLAAVNYLTDHPNEIYDTWYNPYSSPGGILFGFVHKDRDGSFSTYSFSTCSCLTQIRYNCSAIYVTSSELIQAIHADTRIPDSPSRININNLMVFAEWQQCIDKELDREPPPLHPALEPYLPKETVEQTER